MDYEDFERAEPNADSLMQSLRAFGYDTATAVADLIDNSITAQASQIYVNFEWNNGNPRVSIADDGYGMSEAELSEAMKTGSKNPLDERAENDLGRFGLGLKTASFSQCKRLTVASKTNGGQVSIRCWDLDVISERKDWILLKRASESTGNLIQTYFINNNSGTIVIWEKVDRIIPGTSIDDTDYQEAFLSCAKTVKDHISSVFSSYMHGIKKIRFYLNDRIIQMWDPFMTENTYTTRMPSESLYVNGSEVSIKSYILPHQSKLSPEEYERGAGLHGWTAQQGFYIFRNNRLIVAGDWLVPGMEKMEQYRLARIRVDIGNDTDSEWGIDVRKSIAVPPISIQKEIKRIALVAQKESARIYRHRGKKLARTGNKEQFFVWHQNVRHGKLGYEINRNHPIINELLQSEAKEQIRKLIALIEETVPVPMIISDYSEKSKDMMAPFEGKSIDEFDGLIKTLYEVYRSSGCSSIEAIENIASTEPYIYFPEKIALFCEKEGIHYE